MENTNNIEIITFKGVGYPVKIVEHVSGDFKVAHTSLSEALLNSEGYPVNAEAEEIDESIAYYCDYEEFQLSDNELYSLIYGKG